MADILPFGYCPVYAFPFSNFTLSTAGPSDLWCVTANSSSRVAVREIRLNQFSEFGDAQSELLSLQLMRGSTAIGGGTVISAGQFRAHAGAPTAGSSVTGPSTTLASTASASVVIADCWSVALGFYYKPDPEMCIILEPGTRLAVRQSTPNDAISLQGTLILQEIGRG